MLGWPKHLVLLAALAGLAVASPARGDELRPPAASEVYDAVSAYYASNQETQRGRTASADRDQDPGDGGDGGDGRKPKPRKQWWFSATLYAWLQGTNGEVQQGATTVSLDATFTDYLDLGDNFSFLFAHLEARRRRFGAYIDVAYGLVGIDIDAGPITVGAVTVPRITGEFEAEQLYVDYVAFYRVFEMRIDDDPRDNFKRGREDLTVDVLVGVRHTRLTYRLDLSANGPLIIRIGPITIRRTLSAASFEDVTEFVDPIIGARFIYDITDDLTVMVRGDLGGFGAGSDFTWNVVATVDYRFDLFGLPADFFVGYKALYQRFSEGSGDNKFVYEVTTHGPIFGLRLSF